MFTIQIDQKDLNIISRALNFVPFGEVAYLVDKLNKQLEGQIKPTQPIQPIQPVEPKQEEKVSKKKTP